MGLMEQALNAAVDKKAAVTLAHERRQVELCQKAADKFTEEFGLEAKPMGTVQVERFIKKYRDFGGPHWVSTRTQVNRLEVDDLTIGYTPDNQYGPKFWYWKNCRNCERMQAFPIDPIGIFGSDKTTKLIEAIGETIRSTAHCSHCDARPCECCGQTR